MSEALEAHNKARLEQGLVAYTNHEGLYEEAQAWAEACARNGAMSHEGWVKRLQRAGISVGAENLARADGHHINGEGATNLWLESRVGHRENVLSARFNVCGFGQARAGNRDTYWVALYGVANETPEPVEPEPGPDPGPEPPAPKPRRIRWRRWLDRIRRWLRR